FGFLDVAFLLPPTSGEGRGEGRPPVTSMAEPGPNDAGAGMTPDTTRAPQPASRSDNLANLARLDAAFARVLAGSAPTESSPLFSLLNPSLIRYLKHRSTLLAGVTVDSAAVY